MTPRRTKAFRRGPQPAEPVRVHNPQAAGIDGPAAPQGVAVPPTAAPPPAAGPPPHRPPHARTVGACTADLEALADGLRACGVPTVAMESTGVYGSPLAEVLARRGFQVFLGAPRQTRQVSGRPKTDVLDWPWMQRRHRYGLRAASFRPEDQVGVLRGQRRQRPMRLRYAGQQVQHLPKALEQMNVQLTEVVSDITGVTGLAIIQAVVRGQRDPLGLAKLRHERCHRSEAAIARALQGNWREEPLVALRQAPELYETYQGKRRDGDDRIARHLQTSTGHSGGHQLEHKARRRSPQRQEPASDARQALFRWGGGDRTVIEGSDRTTARTIRGELGRDRSKGPTVKHVVSWLGLCPRHQGSAGTLRSRHPRRGANPAARALRLAAQGGHHAQDAPGALERRVQARCGGPKAVVATARTIAERGERLLKDGEAQVRPEMAAAEEAYRARRVKGLARKATELGYPLVPATPEAVLARPRGPVAGA